MSTLTYNYDIGNQVWCVSPDVPTLLMGIINEVQIYSYMNIALELETTVKYKVYIPSRNEYVYFLEADVHASQAEGLTALANYIDEYPCL